MGAAMLAEVPAVGAAPPVHKPPDLVSLSQIVGPPAGGETLTLGGFHFRPQGGGVPVVKFGNTKAKVLSYQYHYITVLVPARVPGTVDVTVTTNYGTSTISGTDRFTYGYAPAVTGVSPGTGPATGGNTVTVNGTGLGGVTSVSFGAVVGTGFVVNGTGTSLTVTAPSGTVGTTVNVTVTNPVGTSAVAPADQYVYMGGPTVTALSPPAGVLAGGTTVTVSGTNLTGATAVKFGGSPGTGISVGSSTSLTVVSPPGSGIVDVTVATPFGTSGAVPADQYVYENAPVVSTVAPSSGPSTGGGLVTVTGTGFLDATAVRFGGTPALAVNLVNATTISAEPPPGTGAEDVIVTTPVGTSTTSGADQYTYLSGVAEAWGDNTYGELGNGSTTDGTSPAAVPGVPAAAQTAGGGASSLALTTTGNVYAWGDNSSGELGNGTLAASPTPIEVPGPGGVGVLSGVVQIASGAAASYALTSSGNVYAWGDNTPGELGTGNNTRSLSPVLVAGPGGTGTLSGIVAIAAHGDSAFALGITGNVYAWGDNVDGQLGINSMTNANAPVAVRAVGGSGTLSGIVQISAGANTVYALTSTGQVDSWGDNTYGQLGNGSTAAFSALPVAVQGVGGGATLSGIVAVSGGLFHAVALTSTGNVDAWGDNSAGELGTSPSSPPQRTPILVPGIGNATQVAAGFDYSMAIAAGGGLYTWGYNLDGELGDGSQNPPTMSGPLQVTGLPPMVALAGGWTQALGLES